jgi:predicted porin
VAVTGRLRFHGALIGQDGDNSPDGRKLSNFDFNTLGRFRLDFTGRNADDIIYGGRLEVRHSQSETNTPANASLFLRVVNGFIGTPTLGQIRFGSNGVLAVPQMNVGHMFAGMGTGTIDGDGPDFVYLGQRGLIANNFWYTSTSNVNRAVGIGYYSPQFFGFDFGISYAPNEAAFLGTCAAAGTAIEGCDRVSRVTGADTARFRNIIDVMLRYRGTFGPVGVAASGGFRTASMTSVTAANGARKDPLVGILGAEVNFAGLTVGGVTTRGNINRGFASGGTLGGITALPKTVNATELDNDGLFSWLIGARYTFGPYTVGIGYHELRSEGRTDTPADLRERGFGIGGSYALGPGIALFADYFFSTVRERGRSAAQDFNSLRPTVEDSFKAQGFLIGVGLGF